MKYIPHYKYSNIELIDCPNCIRLTDRGRCTALHVPYCKGKGCPFMKTREQQEEEIKAVYKRIATLEEIKQKRISEKYYNGKRPWRETVLSQK